MIESIHKSLNHINLHPGIFESIQIVPDAYQSSKSSCLSFSCLNRFTHFVNRFTMLFLAEILHLPPFSIYTHLLITPIFFESFAPILSRSQNLIVHKFFKIKHVFL